MPLVLATYNCVELRPAEGEQQQRGRIMAQTMGSGNGAPQFGIDDPCRSAISAWIVVPQAFTNGKPTDDHRLSKHFRSRRGQFSEICCMTANREGFLHNTRDRRHISFRPSLYNQLMIVYTFIMRGCCFARHLLAKRGRVSHTNL